MNIESQKREEFEGWLPANHPEEIKRELARNLVQLMGRDPGYATKQDWFYALAFFLRGRLSSARVRTWRRNFDQQVKWVYYLSLELLPGRLLRTCLVSQDLVEPCRQALADHSRTVLIVLPSSPMTGRS